MDKIFLWDRNRENIELLITLIEEDYQCECIFFDNQEKLLLEIEKTPCKAILLGSNSEEVIKVISNNSVHLDTPVILITEMRVVEVDDFSEHKSEEPKLNWEDLKSLGYAGYLNKPFYSDDLSKLMKEYGLTKRRPSSSWFNSFTENTQSMILVIDEDDKYYQILKDNINLYIKLARNEEEAKHEYTVTSYTIKIVLINSDNINWRKLLKDLIAISAVPNFVLIGKEDDYGSAIEATKMGIGAYLKDNSTTSELLKKVNDLLINPTFQSKIDLLNNWLYGKTDLSDDTMQDRLIQVLKNSPIMEDGLSPSFDLSKEMTLDELDVGLTSLLGGKIDELPKGKILIIEDEKLSRDQLELALSNEYEIYFALTGVEGLNFFKDNTCDLILLDVKLPDINGDILIKDLIKVKGSAEVIVMTAYPFIDHVVDFLKQRVFNYINKPYNIYELYKTIGLAWLHLIWENIIDKVNIHELPLKDRIYLFNDLLVKRESSEEPVYINDVYSIFPEIYKKKYIDY